MKLNDQAPSDEALESPALILPWARLALEAAVPARKPKKRLARQQPLKADWIQRA